MEYEKEVRLCKVTAAGLPKFGLETVVRVTRHGGGSMEAK